MEQGGRFGSPFLFENGTLRRAKVPDAHPRPDSERQAASVMVQKRAGHPAVRCGLAGGDGRFEQVEKQQVPEIEPHRVGDAAGFGTKAAGPAAQGRHRWCQAVYSPADVCRRRHGLCEHPAMACQQAGQRAVGFMPFGGREASTIAGPEGWCCGLVIAVHHDRYLTVAGTRSGNPVQDAMTGASC